MENVRKGEGQLRRVAGVIVSHGQLATELLAAAEMIIGSVAHIAAISIGWQDDTEAARARDVLAPLTPVMSSGKSRIAW